MIWQIQNQHEMRIILSLSSDSDRAAAIIGATIIENRLEAAIKHHFRDDKIVVSELFRPSGPLGSFSVKIDIAFLLNIVGTVAYRELKTIKDIRNYSLTK